MQVPILGLVINEFGFVYSSYGEMMTKLGESVTDDIFLPDQTVLDHQIKSMKGPLVANEANFVITGNATYKYICEYIGNQIGIPNFKPFAFLKTFH